MGLAAEPTDIFCKQRYYEVIAQVAAERPSGGGPRNMSCMDVASNATGAGVLKQTDVRASKHVEGEASMDSAVGNSGKRKAKKGQGKGDEKRAKASTAVEAETADSPVPLAKLSMTGKRSNTVHVKVKHPPAQAERWTNGKRQ